MCTPHHYPFIDYAWHHATELDRAPHEKIVWKKPEHEWTTSTRQYNRHELCNPFVHLNAMRDHGDPSTWDLCLTSMFPYMLPTDDMLSSIHKHFSSLEVERTCWVADWQKNIVIGWLIGRHSWDKKLRFHELCNPLECDETSWPSVNVRSMHDFYICFPICGQRMICWAAS